VQEVPGRIWEGKEGVLGAVGVLSAACSAALPPEARRRTVAALLDAAGKKRAAYRKEALVQLEAALDAFGSAAGSGSQPAAPAPVAGAAAGGEEAEDYYGMTAPLLLELAGSYLEAARGGGAMEVDEQRGQAPAGGQEEGEPHPGRSVPVAHVAACLGAAFATAAPEAARQHADAAAAALASLLDTAGKAADQLAAAAAGCRLAKHAALVAGRAAAQPAPPVLSPQQEGVSRLLQTGLRLAEEGKVSQLREECYELR
jgi:proteasome component ECM29